MLFEFKVIPSEQAIQQFLTYHHIEPPPDKLWAEIWQALQTGIERSRSYTTNESGTNPRRSLQLHLNRPIRRFWLFVPLLLLVLVALWVHPQTNQLDNLGVIRHTNNWCSATPQGFTSLGDRTDLMYISSDVPVDNFAENPFYVYFHETYVGSDVLSFDGLNATNGEWQAHISPAWVKTHSGWNTLSLWRIDFLCAK